MEEFLVEKAESYNKLVKYLEDYKGKLEWKDNKLITNDLVFHVAPKYKRILSNSLPETREEPIEDLIYGKDKTEGIVSIEVDDDKLYLFLNNGEVIEKPHKYYILTQKAMNGCERLEGDLYFKYITYFDSKEEYEKERTNLYKYRMKYFSPFAQDEAAMVHDGYTLFKGLKVEDVSVLSFDIESEGLLNDEEIPIDSDPAVYLISNTYRDSNGNITRRLFDLADYSTQIEMLEDWCGWVQEIDPSILIGHNVFGYDIPYLNYMWRQERDYDLPLGKFEKPLRFNKSFSKKRKDGSQTISYKNVRCFGRNIIDTMFLAITYDFKRQYVSYKLKQIIQQEGLEKDGRIIWDFDENPTKKIWKEKGVLWDQFREYCEDDGDDALALYDLMIPSFFYYTTSIPRSFQMINNSATGSQINLFLVRSYLQTKHSLPLENKAERYDGAISFGAPGYYKNVLKVDVASLYPSIMIQYQVYDKDKDPKANFLKMVEYFTEERLNNKKLGKDTGDRYYKDMEQAQKIVINSAYGMLGADGLNFNSPKNAAFVTEQGREILQIGVEWATGRRLEHVPILNKNGTPKVDKNTGKIKMQWVLPEGSGGKGYTLVNTDTDSFSYTRGCAVSPEDFEKEIDEINSLYPEKIRWEDDGVFDQVIVVKAKNYVLNDGKKIKYKGSSLTDQKKEPALIEMLHEMINAILADTPEKVEEVYKEYVIKAYTIEDIEPWLVKKTITTKLMESTRRNETVIQDAIKGEQFQEGDKIWVYCAIDGERPKIVKDEIQYHKRGELAGQPKMIPNEVVRLKKKWDGDYNKLHYVNRVYDTANILANVIDMDKIVAYTKNKANMKKFEEFIGEQNL